MIIFLFCSTQSLPTPAVPQIDLNSEISSPLRNEDVHVSLPTKNICFILICESNTY